MTYNPAQMAKDMASMIRNTGLSVSYFQVAIKHLREGTTLHNHPNLDRFLELNKDLPDGAVVVYNKGKLTILVDGEGHVMCFR